MKLYSIRFRILLKRGMNIMSLCILIPYHW